MKVSTRCKLRPFPLAPKYLVAADGRIAKADRSGWLSTKPRSASGYVKLNLFHDGAFLCVDAHRVVALAWLGPPPTPQHEVAHWDGDKTNNAARNLRWATRSENMGDTRRHGRANIGERNGMAKLSNRQARQIARLLTRGVAAQKVARRFGVSDGTVYNIKRKRHYVGVL